MFDMTALGLAAIGIVATLIWVGLWWVIFGKAGFTGAARAVAFVPLLEIALQMSDRMIVSQSLNMSFFMATLMVSAIIAMVPALFLAFSRWPVNPQRNAA